MLKRLVRVGKSVSTSHISALPSVALGTIMLYVLVGAQVAEGQQVPALSIALTSYSPTIGQAKRVTIDVQNEPVAKVLESIASHAELPLIWSRDKVPLNGFVTVSLNNVPVLEAFAVVLSGLSAEARFSTDGQTIIIVPKVALSRDSSTSTSGMISGRVLDSASQRGLSQATVSIAGMNIKTSTSDSGHFTLRNVPAGNRVLQIRLFGYVLANRRVEVSDNPIHITVSLSPAPTVLSGVVTTITGTQRRLEVTHDVTTLNVDSIMAIAPISSVTDLLEARVPGLQVLRTTGTPGDPSRIRLRGAGSLNGNNAPVVVVDGVRIYAPDSSTNGALPSGGRAFTNPRGYPAPSPLDQIDPNSIATIEVFKGPSASSLYGSEAANGVIVITTKRGHMGNARFSATLNAGSSAIGGKFPLNTYIFGHAINQPSRICEFNHNCTVDSIVKFQALNDPRYSPLGRGTVLGASGSVSGGARTFTYFLTGSVSDETGMMRLPSLVTESFYEGAGKAVPFWMRRPDSYRSINGSSAFQLNPVTSLSITLTNALGRSEQGRSSLGITAGEQLMQRYIDPREFAVSPLLRGFQERVTANSITIRNDVDVRWAVSPSIPVNIGLGVNPNISNGKTFLPPGSDLRVRGANDSAGGYSVSRSSAIVSTGRVNTVLPIPVSYGVRVNLGVGADITHQSTSQQTVSTLSVIEGVTDPTSFDPEKTTVSQSGVSTSTYGFFINPQISVGNRIFIQPGIRLDGGSATGNRAGLMRMPKVGLSWIALDGSGRGGLWEEIVSQLKLRAAFGTAGVQPRPEQHLRLYRNRFGSVDGGVTSLPIYEHITIGNTRLIPERSSELEGGLDAVLFNHRVSVNASLYKKMTRDAILQLTTPPSVGAGRGSDFYANVGDIRNTGAEISTNMRMLNLPTLSWDIMVAFTKRQGRVVSLASNTNLLGMAGLAGINSESMQIRVGYPLFGYWARPVSGFSDLNEDGVLQKHEVVFADSARYLGHSEPRYQSTFNTSLSFWNGRLSANAAVDYQNGFAQYNRNGTAALSAAASLPGATFEQQAIAVSQATYYLIQRVNTLRLQSLSFQYQIPSSVVRILSFQNANVALQGSNLGLRTNYSGKDPNVNAYSSGNAVADYGQLPQPRTWSLRFNISR